MTQTIMGERNIQIGTAGAVNIFVTEAEIKPKAATTKRGSRRQVRFREHLLDFIDRKIKQVGISRWDVLDMMNEQGHRLYSFDNLTEWDLFDVAIFLEEFTPMQRAQFSL